ncbi:hypothetical protein [Novipirellula artificiosorum]|uniref:Uncharacterized protein n=1 Tax=Novipirellula artificiosorum TaxID=2528016 RepID=A0A5C6DGN1_9BACT|nr:hypothetical protein [Novipirellula artificiosorum]TWU34881.1 hypothetical protein Poly41_40240 [Novipirellula artificiosorum]
MEKQRPTHEIQIGKIRAAIWANKSKDHDLWFNLTLSRFYQEGGKWQSSPSFGRDDLPVVNKVIDMAYGWILRREAKINAVKNDSAQQGGAIR